MAILVFKVKADLQKVKALRNEINLLEAQLKKVGKNATQEYITGLENKLASLKTECAELTTTAAQTGISLSTLAKGAGIGAAIAGLKNLAGEVIRVRGEFQEMETAIETLIGKDKTKEILPQIKELAKVSPLTIIDIVGAEKMMLGFNIEVDKTVQFLRALSDVSMGSSSKFNSLTLAFSQMSAAGKLMGQDLNQMINAGFNPLQQISETTGKSIATLKKEMSKGAISAEMVQQAFIDATSAGGKYYNMSQNASSTIPGQLSMLEDAIDSALNNMGQASEDIITSGIKATTTLVENYETIGKILAGLVVTYGVYKTAVLTTIAVENLRILGLKDGIKYTWLQISATKAMTVATTTLNKAMTAIKAHPWAILASIVLSAAAAIYEVVTAETELDEAQKRINNATTELNKEISEEEAHLRTLFNTLQNTEKGTKNYELAKQQIISQYGKYLDGLIDEKNNIIDLEAAYLRVTAAVKESAKARKLDEATKAAQGAYGSSFSSAADSITEVLKKRIKSQKEVDTLYQLIMSDVERVGGMTKATEKSLREAFGTENQDSQGRDIDIGKIQNLIGDIRKAGKILEQETNAAKIKFGVVDNEYIGKSKFELLELEKLIKGQIEDVQSLGEVTNIEIYNNKGLVKSYKNLAEAQLDLYHIRDALKQQSVVTPRDTVKENLSDAKREMDNAEKAWREAIKQNKKTSDIEKLRKEYESKKTVYEDLQKTAGIDPKKQKQKERAEKKANEALLKIRKQNAEDRVALMRDSSEKERMQLLVDYETKIREIEKQEKEWKKAQNGSLTSEQSAALDTAAAQAGAKLQKDYEEVLKAEERAERDYLLTYGTLAEKRVALAADYAEKMEKATTEGARKSLEKEYAKAEQELLLTEFKSSDLWVRAFGDMENASDDSLNAIIAKLKELRDATASELKPDELREYNEAIKRAEDELLSRKDVIEQYRVAQERYNAALAEQQRIEATLNGARESGDGTIIIGSETKLVDGVLQVVPVVESMADAQERMRKAADKTKEAYNNLNKAAVAVLDTTQELLSAISSVGNSLSSLGSTLGNDWLSAIGSSITGVSGSISSGMSAFDAIKSAFAANSKTGLLGQMSSLLGGAGVAIQGIQMVSGLIGSFKAMADKDNEKRIESLQDSIDDLTEANEDLQRAMEGTYSVTKKENLQEQNRNLQQQQSLIQQQIAEEQSKKDPDDDRIKEWQSQLRDIQQQIEDNRQAMIEAMTGTSTQEAITSFSDGLVGAWEAHTDAVKASMKTAKQLIKTGVVQYLNDQLSGLAKAFNENLARYLEDGYISEWEDSQLMAEAEMIAEQGQRYYEQVKKYLDFTDDGSEGSSNAVSGMSQDTGDAIEGRMTAIQISVEAIRAQNAVASIGVNQINESLVTMLAMQGRNYELTSSCLRILAESYLELQEINSNTKETNKRIKENIVPVLTQISNKL